MTVRRRPGTARGVAPVLLLAWLPACAALGGGGPSPFPFVGDDKPWTVESEHRDGSPRRMGERLGVADSLLPPGPITPNPGGGARGSPGGYEPVAVPRLYERPSKAVLRLWEVLAYVAYAVYWARELEELGNLGDPADPCLLCDHHDPDR